jgi:signal peptidase I
LEAQLLKIGFALLAYALIVRQMFKYDSFLKSRLLVSFLHVFFMGAVGAMVGFVVSASVDLHGPTPRWPIALGIVGIIWGFFQTSRKSKTTGNDLLAGDLELAETSYSAVILAAVIMYAVVQAFKIPSGSMENTLLIGDHLFVNKFIYGVRVPYSDKRLLKWRDVQRGDIIVFQCPPYALSEEERAHNVRKDFIKRAVALPGDEVQVKNKRLYINGKMQEEPYVVYKDPMIIPDTHRDGGTADFQKSWEQGDLAQYSYIRDNFGPVKVPADHFFVVGDNRDGSFDGRFWGPLPSRLLKGKAWVVYWPLRRIKVIR